MIFFENTSWSASVIPTGSCRVTAAHHVVGSFYDNVAIMHLRTLKLEEETSRD